MDKKDEKKDHVVVRNDTGEKVSSPMTESEATKMVNDKSVKESSGSTGVSVKKILHG
jgi:hypothetical protein